MGGKVSPDPQIPKAHGPPCIPLTRRLWRTVCLRHLLTLLPVFLGTQAWYTQIRAHTEFAQAAALTTVATCQAAPTAATMAPSAPRHTRAFTQSLARTASAPALYPTALSLMASHRRRLTLCLHTQTRAAPRFTHTQAATLSTQPPQRPTIVMSQPVRTSLSRAWQRYLLTDICFWQA